MPFFNILYKNNPEQINKETQISEVKGSETNLRKSQSSSVLLKAQPYLKSIPIKQ